jgi:hypothetical protein
MSMSPPVRKLALVTHVASSVGWLGGVATSLILAIAGLASDDIAIARAAYLTLEIVGWYVLIPLSFASLLSGLIQSLGTTWGLLRHYWVLIKLLMNLFATGVLLLYMQTLAHFAALARTPATDLGDPSPVLHAGAAMLLLLVATVLSVYKPRGLTAYGRRKQVRLSGTRPATSS